MKYGNISNEPVPKIGFRFEEIIRRSSDGKLNRSGKAYLERVANFDISIVLFTTDDERKCRSFCYKWEIPYSGVVAVDSVLDLVQVCREQTLLQYWDTEKDILSKIHERIYKPTEVMLWTLQDNSYLE